MIKYNIITSGTFWIVLILFCSLLGQSQSYRTEFEFLSARDGLAQNHVFHINQDPDGFMWFCTMGGLSKYDGFTFTNYYHSEEDSTTISSNYVTNFFIDSKKRYWVTTTNGLNLFNRNNGKFKRYQHQKDNPNTPGDNNIREIKEDSSGNLWLVHNRGVDKFNPKTGSFVHYVAEEFQIGRHSGNIEIDASDNIWVNAVFGFYKVHQKEKKLIKYDFPKIKAEVPLEGRKLYIDSDGTIWVGLNRGLAIFDQKKQQLSEVKLGLQDINVIDMTEYLKGNLVIGTAQNGFAIYDLKQKKITSHFKYSPSDPRGLGGSTIYSFYVDKDKNLWIGLFSGINRINMFMQRFNLLEFETGINNYSNFTLLVHQDKTGGLWANTMEGFFYKKNNITPHNPVLPIPEFRKGHNDVLSIESDENNHVYFNIRYKNLYRYHTLTDKLESLDFGGYFTKMYAYKLLNDVKDPDILWFGGNDGLGYFHKKSLDTVIYRPKKYFAFTENNNIYRFTQTKNRFIFFVISEKLIEFDVDNEIMKVRNPDFTIKGRCYAITHQDSLIWIGTTSHVYRYNLKTNQYTTVKKMDGLTEMASVGLQTDDLGNVWSIQGSEVTRINPHDCSVNHFHSPTSFVNGIGTTTPDGRVIFGGSNGTLFLPKDVKKNPTNSKIVFTGLEVANKPVRFETENEYIDKIELNYEDKVFTLRYAALSFIDRDFINYAYVLEGFDDKWINAGTKREVTYTNLRPGNYIFKVIGINEDGKLLNKSLELHIHIKPPFYLTIPFLLFIFIFVIALIYIYYKTNQKALLMSKEKELAEKNSKYKDMFMSNMSHEIRTPMNAIIGLNKILLNTPVNEEQKKYLDAIQTSGENLLWIVNDILDQAKIESGQYNIVTSPFDLHKLISKIETLFSYRAHEKKLTFDIRVDDHLPAELIGDQVRIFQILTNLLNNAFKFTEKGIVSLDVVLKEANTQLFWVEFNVTDTGIGIPNDKISDIFVSFHQLHQKETIGNQGVGLGLSIVKNLTNLLGGKISVASEPNKGTKISISLPLEKNITEKKSKTSVSYNIPKNLKILIVEDTPINQMIVVELLKIYIPDAITEVVENGMEALTMLQTKSFDLILMDVKMPVMNGIDTTKAIRLMEQDHIKNIPVLGLTASAIPGQIKSYIDAGMNDVITKPINADEMMEKIHKICNDD